MKFSEGIRLGSMMYGQAFGGGVTYTPVPGSRWRRVWRSLTKGRTKLLERRTCAFQAAMDAHPCKVSAGGTGLALRGPTVVDAAEGSVVLPGEWQVILGVYRECPACVPTLTPLVPIMVFHLVAHLNDTHRWTREQIADWIEGVEREVFETNFSHRFGDERQATTIYGTVSDKDQVLT